MAKINPNGLPNKINMRDLSIILGSGGAMQATHLNEILLSAESYQLPIYFHQEMYGAEVSGGLDPIVDEHGDVTKVMVNGNCLHTGTNKSTFLTGQGFDHTIMVSSYSHNGKDYYPTDDTGIWQDNSHIPAICFFCDKNELLASGLLGQSAMSRKKPITKQQQREQAFENWLATKSGITTKSKSQYQDCYVAIREPTQDSIWAELQKVDPHLFACNKTDFFKHQKIIRFKDGTGKGR